MSGTALVLSGGGMFGAYQAGVWLALEEILQPDIIVGASVGALNGWAIAGGIPAAKLVETWLESSRGTALKMKFPRSWRDGFLDPAALESWVQDLHRRWQPRLRIGVALTEMWRMRPVLVEDRDITWQHLTASCAVPGFLPQYRLNGHCYADGGFLDPLPVWAAKRMGATRVVAVNLLPAQHSPLMAIGATVLRRIFRPAGLDGTGDLQIVLIAPDPPLDSPRGMVYWERAKIESWIERGRVDALAKKHSVCDMF